MSNRTSRHWNAIDSDPFTRENRWKKDNCRSERDDLHEQRRVNEEQFRCLNCSLLIVADPAIAGVNNRNHCPNCLWSKHVDLNKPGDRKATCRARMRPVGLTVKHVHKKYGSTAQGELMIIHQCSGCGKISINRIAADDAAGALLQLYQHSQSMDEKLREKLVGMDIQPLAAADLTTVYSQLFGWQSILGEFTPPLEVAAELEKSLSANQPNFS